MPGKDFERKRLFATAREELGCSGVYCSVETSASMRHTLRIVISLLCFGALQAQNSDETHIRATVQAVVPLTSFAGQVTPVGVDPRFAMTVHLESVKPTLTNFPEGAAVTFAIHSPALLFAGEPMIGKAYDFSLRRTLEHGTTKFLSLTVDLGLSQLEQFVGVWEIRNNPATGRANLTVIIVPAGDTISGTIKFVNPDGTTIQCPISHPDFRGTTLRRSLVFNTDFKGPTVDFQTQDHDAIMYWSLTLTTANRGFLRGDEHEVLIEEKVNKRR